MQWQCVFLLYFMLKCVHRLSFNHLLSEIQSLSFNIFSTENHLNQSQLVWLRNRPANVSDSVIQIGSQSRTRSGPDLVLLLFLSSSRLDLFIVAYFTFYKSWDICNKFPFGDTTLYSLNTLFYPIITEIIITVIVVVIIIIGIIEKNEMVMKRNKFFLFINRQTWGQIHCEVCCYIRAPSVCFRSWSLTFRTKAPKEGAWGRALGPTCQNNQM